MIFIDFQSLFTDCALIFENEAFLCSMGAKSRRKERTSVLPELEKLLPVKAYLDFLAYMVTVPSQIAKAVYLDIGLSGTIGE